MYVYDADSALCDCVFTSNTAFFGGGDDNLDAEQSHDHELRLSRQQRQQRRRRAVHIGDSSPTIANCVMGGNAVLTGGNAGGAVWIDNNSDADISNCTIVGNEAPQAGGLTTDGSVVTVGNTILWGKRGRQRFDRVGSTA